MIKQIIWTNRFKKDYKLSIKRGLPIEELDNVIMLLANDKPLSEKYQDHELTGCGKDFVNAIFSLTGY